MPTSKQIQDSLAYPPRGMRASRAAAYLGMSETAFLTLVEEGQIPKPKHIKGMRIWDRFKLDLWFEQFNEETDDKPRRSAADRILGLDEND